MTMFTRDPETYQYDPAIIDCILQDDANPLRIISDLIPGHSKVLDIGAGSGLLAVVMKALHKGVVIDGIEPDSHAASMAKSYYRSFWIDYVQNVKDTIRDEHYNYIVMADVLEHFQDPLFFLQQLISWTLPETKIVLSIPNVAYGAVRLELLRGNFSYVDSGILEKTHLRFFTLETLQQLIAASGLAIEKLCFLQRDFLGGNRRQAMSEIGGKVLRKLVKDETASTFQFVVVLSSAAAATETFYYGSTTRLSLYDVIRLMLRV